MFLEVLSKGKHVLGHDHQRCSLQMSVRALEGLRGLDPPPADERPEVGEWRRVRVTVPSPPPFKSPDFTTRFYEARFHKPYTLHRMP